MIEIILKDIALPLLVTFLTYVISSIFFSPISKWREIRDELIIASTQYANYLAYFKENKEGVKKLEDRGLYNTVEQDLRRLAGRILTLPDYPAYKFWKRYHLTPDEDIIEKIRGNLIGWANSLVEHEVYSSFRELCIEGLKKNLDLPNNYDLVKENHDLEMRNRKNK